MCGQKTKAFIYIYVFESVNAIDGHRTTCMDACPLALVMRMCFALIEDDILNLNRIQSNGRKIHKHTNTRTHLINAYKLTHGDKYSVCAISMSLIECGLKL